MYSTKTATVNNSEFNSNYMPVGINEDVILKEVNVKKSTTNKDFIEFVFSNEQGQTATMTEWKNEKNMWIKTDEDLQKRDDQQFGRILQILNCFYPDGVEEANISTFAEMINWVSNKLPSTLTADKKLRLKVIYDKKGYTTVSSYGIFVELSTIAKESSQIKLFKNDLLERAVVADKEPANDPFAAPTNSISAEETLSQTTGDLPF